MCKNLMLTIYRLMLTRSSARAALIEERLGFDRNAAPLSEDDSRNERDIYISLFSEDCRPFVEGLVLDMSKELSALPYERSADVLSSLALVQEMIATALWKYKCAVGPRLESFAREFDRLDRDEERLRLYEHTRRTLR
jgi:hypothetical protein